MKRRFRENRFASEQGLGDFLGDVNRPRVMVVVGPCKGHDEARVRNGLHERENPLREDTSGGPPLIAPAWRRNRCFPPPDLAASSCWRMSRPTGTPVWRDFSLSQLRSSSVRRIVSV